MSRSMTPSSSSASALHARWQALAPREQSLLLAASAVVAVALLWWLALAPALHTLRSAPARHASLDKQLQQMQALQAEALQLQAQPRADQPDTDRARKGPRQACAHSPNRTWQHAFIHGFTPERKQPARIVTS